MIFHYVKFKMKTKIVQLPALFFKDYNLINIIYSRMIKPFICHRSFELMLIMFLNLFLSFIFVSCDPFVDPIDEVRNCDNYSKTKSTSEFPKDTILIMTWNIRFGCGTELLWFGDACGERTILERDEVETNLDLIVKAINTIKPDILLLQEVDVNCKRTAYIDEMKYIMDRTYFNYGYYGTNWNIQFIPSDGIGKINEGNSILSIWPMSDVKLHPLPLRNDLDALTKYFYVREIVMSGKITMPNGTELNVLNTHLSAFSTDNTKKRQLEEYIFICEELNATGIPLITGGDYNLLPPNSDSLDYCDEDKCVDEHFHSPGDDPMHKEGSNYAPEINWLNLLYDSFYPSLPLEVYKVNQQMYFSHATFPNIPYDRTLDYLFANRPWISSSHKSHQEFRKYSDHASVTALINIGSSEVQ